MRNCLNDLRFACRALAKNKIFCLVAVLILLGLGIGMNTAIFSGVYGYLWTPLPYPDAESLVALAQMNPVQGIERVGLSSLDVDDWRAAKGIEAIAAYHFDYLGLNAGNEPIYVTAISASPNLFEVLRVQPSLGRGFGAAERSAGEERVLLSGVPPHDPLTLAVISAVLIVSGLVACGVPAVHATPLDPVSSLRVE